MHDPTASAPRGRHASPLEVRQDRQRDSLFAAAAAVFSREGRHGRVGASVRAFLEVVAAFPDEAQTLLVEIIGAGPRAMERRDRVLARVLERLVVGLVDPARLPADAA